MKKTLILFTCFALIIIPVLALGDEGKCIEGNCQDGKGTIEYGWKKYEGEFKNGLPNGHGTLKDKNSEKEYFGEFKNGKKHGRGVEGYPGSDGKIGYWLYDIYVGKEKPEELK